MTMLPCMNIIYDHHDDEHSLMLIQNYCKQHLHTYTMKDSCLSLKFSEAPAFTINVHGNSFSWHISTVHYEMEIVSE